MAQYDIHFNYDLPYAYCGSDNVASVELSDEEVASLVSLIRQHGGSTDIEVLDLEDKFPEIYEKLDYACLDQASEMAFEGWAVDGYEDRLFDRPVDLMDKCEAAGLFHYEPDMDEVTDDNGEIDPDLLADDKDDCFDEWLDEYFYSLDWNGQVAFLMRFYEEALDDYSGLDFTYSVEIPDAIVKMALEG